VALLDPIINRLAALFAPVVGPIKGLINIITKFKQNTVGLLDKGQHFYEGIGRLFDSIKNFQEKPHWKSRVVSVPRAVKNIKELTQIPVDIFNRVKELFQTLREQTNPAELEPAELEGVEDLRAFGLKLGTKLGEAFGKVLDVAGIILQILIAINTALDDLNGIIDDANTFVEDFNNLDGLFLPQKNPRKIVQSTDGPLRLRIGSLHGG